MSTICGICCDSCSFKPNCKGCCETEGHVFGGNCVAAEYIKLGGKDKYNEFKAALLTEINELLAQNDISAAAALFELAGFYVNLEYELPSGSRVKFLDDKNVYLGCQIELEGGDRCVGVIADTTFILVCSYGANGSAPELIAYKKR